MIGKILCFLMWHKWDERRYSIKYRLKGEWCQTTSVRCLRPGCKRSKGVTRRV